MDRTTYNLLKTLHELPFGWLMLLGDATRAWQAAGRPDWPQPGPGIPHPGKTAEHAGVSRTTPDRAYDYYSAADLAATRAALRRQREHLDAALDLVSRFVTTNNLDHHRAERCLVVDDANDLLAALDANLPREGE